MSCRVVVDQVQLHKHQRRPFGVRIDVMLPGRERVVDRVSGRFEQLRVGTAVQVIADIAAAGLQAQRVSLGKHCVALGKGRPS
jgi:hypothetical protein